MFKVINYPFIQVEDKLKNLHDVIKVVSIVTYFLLSMKFHFTVLIK